MKRLMKGLGAVALGATPLLALGAMAGSAGAVQSAAAVSAGGTTTCQAVGKYLFSPSLTNAGVVTTMSIKVSLTNCSGSAPVSGGSLSATAATSTALPLTCGSFLNEGVLPTVTGLIRWSGSAGPVMPSAVTIAGANNFTNLSGSNGNLVSVDLPTAITSGSFSGSGSSVTFANLLSKLTNSALGSKCGAGSTGLKGFTFGTGSLSGAVTVTGAAS